MSGLKDQKGELTVGKLMDILENYDEELPVYFGANFKIKTRIEDNYGYEQDAECEFDDWLEFKEWKLSEQAYRVGDKIKTRQVMVLELDY